MDDKTALAAEELDAAIAVRRAEAVVLEAKRSAKRAELQALTVEDVAGAEWQARALGKWNEAVDLAAVVEDATPIEFYQPEPLPDFTASAPAHVTRELLGRFLVDRDTSTVHDCYAATPACGLDGIRNGTFYHFWTELLDNAVEEIPCAECLG